VPRWRRCTHFPTCGPQHVCRQQLHIPRSMCILPTFYQHQQQQQILQLRPQFPTRVCVTGPHPCKANRASAVVLHLSCCFVQLLTDLKDMKGLPCCFSNRKQRFGRKGLTKLSQIPVNSLAHLCFSHPRHEPLEETHQAAFHAEFRWWWFAVHLQDQTKCIMVAATIAQVHGVKQRLVTQVGEDIVNAT